MSFKSIHSGVSVVLSMALLVGSPLLASETVAIRSSDYRLGQESILAGSVVNQSGLPVAGLPVQILHKGQVVATAMSDDKGEFAVQGLRNGQHSVKVGASQQSVRLWTSKAAPPTAVSRLAIVVDEEVVRGQCGESCGEGVAGADQQAWKAAAAVLLIGGAVATALALTLDHHDSVTPASP